MSGLLKRGLTVLGVMLTAAIFFAGLGLVLVNCKQKQHSVEMIRLEKYEMHAADAVSVEELNHLIEIDTAHATEK